jgi:hypothetical protein
LKSTLSAEPLHAQDWSSDGFWDTLLFPLITKNIRLQDGSGIKQFEPIEGDTSTPGNYILAHEKTLGLDVPHQISIHIPWVSNRQFVSKYTEQTAERIHSIIFDHPHVLIQKTGNGNLQIKKGLPLPIGYSSLFVVLILSTLFLLLIVLVIKRKRRRKR